MDFRRKILVLPKTLQPLDIILYKGQKEKVEEVRRKKIFLRKQLLRLQ